LPALSGFVTYLYICLLHQLKQFGQWRPASWFDRSGIERAEQLADIITANRSDYLLVNFFENWLSRAWCLQELECFPNRRTTWRIMLSPPPAVQGKPSTR
jgi:hypothetical protein